MKVGDVVILEGHTTRMTIKNAYIVSGDTIGSYICTWFDEDNKLWEDVFMADQLVLASEYTKKEYSRIEDEKGI